MFSVPYSFTLGPPAEDKREALISQEDIDNHNKEGGGWVVIHDKVYDLLSFASQAPCGRSRLMEVVGKDATKVFETVGHSDFACELMGQFLVGHYREAAVSN